MRNQADPRKPRGDLSADALIQTLRRRFQDIPDHRRQASCNDSMSDTPMSAFAMFAFAILATKELQRWLFEDQYYLVAIDSPGYFCADHIKCDPCMVRRSGGKAQYDHQVVAAVLAHPI